MADQPASGGDELSPQLIEACQPGPKFGITLCLDQLRVEDLRTAASGHTEDVVERNGAELRCSVGIRYQAPPSPDVDRA